MKFKIGDILSSEYRIITQLKIVDITPTAYKFKILQIKTGHMSNPESVVSFSISFTETSYKLDITYMKSIEFDNQLKAINA